MPKHIKIPMDQSKLFMDDAGNTLIEVEANETWMTPEQLEALHRGSEAHDAWRHAYMNQWVAERPSRIVTRLSPDLIVSPSLQRANSWKHRMGVHPRVPVISGKHDSVVGLRGVSGGDVTVLDANEIDTDLLGLVLNLGNPRSIDYRSVDADFEVRRPREPYRPLLRPWLKTRGKKLGGEPIPGRSILGVF